MLAGPQIDGEGIVIDGDCRNRGAVGPQHIIDRPAAWKSLQLEKAVVCNYAAFNFFHTAGHHGIGQCCERFFGRPVAFDFFLVRKLPIREVRVTAAGQHQVAV